MSPRPFLTALALALPLGWPIAGHAAALPHPPVFDGGDTAWMLLSTVLVLLMSVPGLVFFYSGMLRAKNALSIAAHTVAGAAAVTLTWAVLGYSLAFTHGNPFLGDASRLFALGLIGQQMGAHPLAASVPESVFFLFQLAFATVAFSLVLGATAERQRIGATLAFAPLWVLAVYAPVAHWVWQPGGWLSDLGHMDFAGGTVVHIAAGASALAAAQVVGPRRGFGHAPMLPHNLLASVLGAGLIWVGWFGFNAGSAFSAGPRAAGALLATQVAACSGALIWGLCETLRRRQWSVLGSLSGAIAGLVAITPASGYVGIGGALVIGTAGGAVCFFAVVNFKAFTHVDDTLDVFALHGVGGLVGTVLTPLCATPLVAPVTSTVGTNLMGSVTVMAYAYAVTWVLLQVVGVAVPLRVDEASERAGLDLSQHGETLSAAK